jgi:hypothetical protein
MSSKQKRREFLVKGLTLGAMAVTANTGLPMCLRAAFAGGRPQKTPGAAKEKSLEELAYCGYDCSTCILYKATQENDLKVKEEVAKGWLKHYGVAVKPEDVACDGCRSKTGRLSYPCDVVCDVRKCGVARGITSCAVCPDFPACGKEQWKRWPDVHKLTEERRKQISQKGDDGPASLKK